MGKNLDLFISLGLDISHYIWIYLVQLDKCLAMGVWSLSVDTSGDSKSGTPAQSSASSSDSGIKSGTDSGVKSSPDSGTVRLKQYKQRGGTVFGLFAAAGSGATGSTLSPSVSPPSSTQGSPPSAERSSNKSCHSRGNSSDNGSSTTTSPRESGRKILQNAQYPRDTESPKLRPFHRQRSASESISEKLKDSETMKNKELEELWPDHNSLDRNTSQYANNAAAVRSAKLANSGVLDVGCQECQREQNKETIHGTRTPMGANASRTLLPKSRSFVLPQRPAFNRLHNNIDRSRTSKEDQTSRTRSRVCRDRSVPADNTRRRQGADPQVRSETRGSSAGQHVPPLPHSNYLDSAQVLKALQPQKGLAGIGDSAGNVYNPSESAAVVKVFHSESVAAAVGVDCKVSPSVNNPRRYSLDTTQILQSTPAISDASQSTPGAWNPSLPPASAGAGPATSWKPTPPSAGPGTSSYTQPYSSQHNSSTRNNRQQENPIPSSSSSCPSCEPLQQQQPPCGMRDRALLMGGCLDLPFHHGTHRGSHPEGLTRPGGIVRHGSSLSSIYHVSYHT